MTQIRIPKRNVTILALILLLVGLSYIVYMSNLNGLPDDTSSSNHFVTIPDVPLDTLATRVVPRQVATGVTRGVQYLGSDKVYSDGGNQQVIVEDTSNPRVMMGNHATFGEGFFVTKTGYNVKTETDPANYSFNSNQNHLKIIASGDVTVTRTAGNTTGTATVSYASYGFAQSLSPGLLAFSSGSPLPQIGVDDSGATAGLVSSRLDCTINYFSQTITFQLIAPDYAGNILHGLSQNAIIHYYLTQETAN